MDRSKQPPQTPEKSGIGIVRDVRQLRGHGEATAAELREFLAQTRGRSPQEVLGTVAGSRLTRSIALATVLAVLVLAAGSIVPWLLDRATSVGESPAKAAAGETATTAPTDEAEATRQAATPVASVTDTANPRPSPADAEKAVEAMGLGDTKTVDPESNPLENTLDQDAWYYGRSNGKLNQSVAVLLVYSLLFVILAGVIGQLLAGRESYELPAGGGQTKTLAQTIRVQKIVRTKYVVNPYSAIRFEVPPIDEVQLRLNEVTEQASRQYADWCFNQGAMEQGAAALATTYSGAELLTKVAAHAGPALLRMTADPETRSKGQRMAAEGAGWLRQHLPPEVSTPEQRELLQKGLLAVADVHAAAGQDAKVAEVYDEIIRRLEASDEILGRLAAWNESREKFDEAYEVYRRFEKRPEGLARIARGYRKRKLPAAAINTYGELAGLDAENQTRWTAEIAATHREAREFAKSIGVYRQLMENDPTSGPQSVSTAWRFSSPTWASSRRRNGKKRSSSSTSRRPCRSFRTKRFRPCCPTGPRSLFLPTMILAKSSPTGSSGPITLGSRGLSSTASGIGFWGAAWFTNRTTSGTTTPRAIRCCWLSWKRNSSRPSST